MPFLPPGDLPDSGTKPTSLASPALQADSLPIEPLGKPSLKVLVYNDVIVIVFRHWD